MFSLFKKELRSYFFSPFAYAVAALFLMLFWMSLFGGISHLSGHEYRFSFANIFSIYLLFFVFSIPFLTMWLFAEERKERTEVLLMTSPLNVFQIVLAKFLAISAVFLMMVGLTLFYPLVTYFTGSVMWSSLICGYIGFFLWGLVCLSIGMLISSFTESPVIAWVISEVAMLILYQVDSIKTSGLFKSFPKAVQIIGAFSMSERFERFSSGFLTVSDIIFFVSVTILFVGLTIISVSKRRWSRG